VPEPLLRLTDCGLYCEAADVYVDPWRPVPRAVVTHAHGDHLTRGCDAYLIAEEGLTVTRVRLYDDAEIETLPYGAPLALGGGVTVSFHPAGHILGSAQVRLERGGEVWVVTGDFATDPNPTCTPFEPVRCDTLIMESTFALPIYRWPSGEEVADEIRQWWAANQAAGRTSIVFAYSLGKAQRVLAGLDPAQGPLFGHGAVQRLNEAYRQAGRPIPPTTYAGDFDKTDPAHRGGLVVAPLSVRGTSWIRRFGEVSTAFASGWTRVRGARRRRAVDRGFVLSDHADWDGLTATVEASGAARVLPTHGYTAVLARWCRERGLEAEPLETRFRGEADEEDTDDA